MSTPDPLNPGSLPAPDPLALAPGGPIIDAPTKRSFDTSVVKFDWHDFLAQVWQPGSAVATSFTVRPLRAQATGLEFVVSTAGVTSGAGPPAWPTVVGGTVADGTAVWTAQALSTASMRTTVTASAYAASSPDITLPSNSVADYVYSVLVAGGTSGLSYDVTHQITLADGERKEGIALVSVKD